MHMHTKLLHSCPETPTAFLFPIGLSQVPLNGEGIPGSSQGLPHL